jgi:Uma2 family endonuclease
MMLLLETLGVAWKDRKDYFAAGNMFVYYSQLQAKKNDFRGPDVFVVLETVWKERKSWVVWEEDGKTPDVVIELISPSTEATDRGEKMRIYSKLLKVGHYYLFDPFTKILEGYELDPNSWTYRPIQPDDHGWFPCQSLELSLGVVPGEFQNIQTEWLRWIDSEGKVLLHSLEIARSEAQRAEQEAQRAEQEAQRAEQEAQRAEQEAQRADQEAQRADQEAQRADTAEQELADLRARLTELEAGRG